jgi:hypothetical protein
MSIKGKIFKLIIYRKPTKTDSVILHDSNQLFTQKISFFNSLFFRLEPILFIKLNYLFISTQTQFYP